MVSVHAAGDTASCPLQWRLALDMLDALADWGMSPPVVVADAAYGTNAHLRAGLAQRGIDYMPAVRADVSAHPFDVQRVAPDRKGPADCRTTTDAAGFRGDRPCLVQAGSPRRTGLQVTEARADVSGLRTMATCTAQPCTKFRNGVAETLSRTARAGDSSMPLCHQWHSPGSGLHSTPQEHRSWWATATAQNRRPSTLRRSERHMSVKIFRKSTLLRPHAGLGSGKPQVRY